MILFKTLATQAVFSDTSTTPTCPTTLIAFQQCDIGVFSQLHAKIGQQTWIASPPLQRNCEAQGLDFSPHYLAALSLIIGEPITSYLALISHLGPPQERLPSLYRPLQPLMIYSSAGPPINATPFIVNHQPYGLVSELPTAETLSSFLEVLTRKGVTSIVSLASATEMPTPYWQGDFSASKTIKFTPKTQETWGEMGQFIVTSPDSSTHTITVNRINPEGKNENGDATMFDDMWKTATSISKKTQGTPQTLAHCFLGLARSVSYKILELFLAQHQLARPDAPFDITNIVVTLREQRPAVFPYEDAFVQLCAFLQKKNRLLIRM